MAKSDELRELLENLKKEIPYSYSYDLKNEDINKFKTEDLIKKNLPTQQNIFTREKINTSKFNVVWSENKETLLFGLLVSVIMTSIGVLSKIDYIVLAGVISFVLFSIVSFLAFFRYILSSSEKNKRISEISEKIDFLERKIELMSKNLGVGTSGNEKYYELEGKIEELRAIVKTLTQK